MTVWDDSQTSYDSHMHKHIYDIATVDILGGPDIIVTPAGRVTVDWDRVDRLHPFDAVGRARYFPGAIGPHREGAVNLSLPQRAIFIEIKRTLHPDASRWSTDPTGATGAAFPLFVPPQPVALPSMHLTQQQWPSLGSVLEASGAAKILDNESVTIWDEMLTTTQHSLRKTVRDVLAVEVWDGATMLVNGEEQPELELPRGADQDPRRKMPSVYYFEAGTGPYSFAATDPRRPRRTIWIELKGTDAPDCKAWSTDPACG